MYRFKKKTTPPQIMSAPVFSSPHARPSVRGGASASSHCVDDDTSRRVPKWCYRGAAMATWPAVLLAGLFGMSVGGASFSPPENKRDENKRDENKRVKCCVRSSAAVPALGSSSVSPWSLPSSSCSSFAHPVVAPPARLSFRAIGKKENNKKRKRASSPAQKKQMCGEGSSSDVVSSSIGAGSSSSSSSASGAGSSSSINGGSMSNDGRRKKRVRFSDPLVTSSSSSSSAISAKEMASRFVSENVSAGQKYSINGCVAKVENIRRSSGSTLWSHVGVRWKGGGYRSNIGCVKWKQLHDQGAIEFLASKKKAPTPCPATLHCDYSAHWQVVTSFDKCKGEMFVGWCTGITGEKITLTWTDQSTSQYGFKKFHEFMEKGHIKEMEKMEKMEDENEGPPFYPNGTELLLTYGGDGKFVGRVSHLPMPVIRIYWKKTSEEEPVTFTEYSLNLFKSALEVGDIEEMYV